MGALTTYITQVRQLLHDPNSQYWSDTELTGYINEARNRVAQDTECLRKLVTSITLTATTETFVVQTILPTDGPYVTSVNGITVYWGNSRVKLQYRSFTEFDALIRGWQNYQGTPRLFTRLGATQVYVGPIPDQNYVSDWDVTIIPNPLVSDGTTEQMPVPFLEPVQYYAAFKAKWKEQSMGEANIFLQQYVQTAKWCRRSYMPRIVPDPYAR